MKSMITKGNSFKYYLFTVGSIELPIAVYILFPGVSVLPTVISALLVFVFFNVMRKSNLLMTNNNILGDFRWFFIIIAFGAIRSLFSLESSHEVIALLIAHIASWFMICICYMIKDIKSISQFSCAYLFILIPLAFLSAFSWQGFLTFDVPHVLMPLSLFLIISPYLSTPKRIIIALALLLSMIYDSSSRACLLTMGICFVFFVSYYFLPRIVFRRFLVIARVLFFVIPIILIILGATGRYNVFAGFEGLDVSSYNVESRKSGDRALNVDSRTVVYTDVLHNIEGFGDLMFGKGSVIILPSTWISDRHSTEAEILNIFLRYGILGCLVFFALLWKISKKGMHDTNNTFTMLVSVYIAYRFLFMFIEDAGLNPSIYIALGICLNPAIRKMTDEQIKKSI